MRDDGISEILSMVATESSRILPHRYLCMIRKEWFIQLVAFRRYSKSEADWWCSWMGRRCLCSQWSCPFCRSHHQTEAHPRNEGCPLSCLFAHREYSRKHCGVAYRNWSECLQSVACLPSAPHLRWQWHLAQHWQSCHLWGFSLREPNWQGSIQ